MSVALKQHSNRDHAGESLRMVDVSVKHQDYLPEDVADLLHPQIDIPRLPKDQRLVSQIEAAVATIPTKHRLLQGDAHKGPGPLLIKAVKDHTVEPIPERGQEPAQVARPTCTSLELQYTPLNTDVLHSCTDA